MTVLVEASSPVVVERPSPSAQNDLSMGLAVPLPAARDLVAVGG